MNAASILSLAWAQFWQLSLVIVLVAVAARTVFRNRPHWAYALWVLALIKCLTPPLWSSPTGVFSWATLERTPLATSAPMVEPATSVATSATNIAPASPAMEPSATDAFTPASPPLELAAATPNAAEPAQFFTPEWALLNLWALGTLSVLFVCGLKIVAMRRQLRRAALPAPPELVELLGELRTRIGTARRVQLVVSSEPWGPALLGLFRPQLILPEALVDDRPRAELAPIVAHELVHLRRGDHLVAALQLATQAIWWFHPLVWWMNREMNRAREMSCDEEVLAALDCEPATYAQTLLDVVRLRRQLRGALFAPGMRSVQVTAARLGHILTHGTSFHRRTPVVCWAVIALVALVLLPGGRMALSNAATAEDAPREAQTKSAETAADGAITFTGSVVDAATEKPLAGATVILHRLSGQIQQKLVETSESLTDAQGNYRVTIPAAQANDDRLYLVAGARHPQYADCTLGGYSLAMIKSNLKQGENPFFSRIEMLPGDEVTAVIVDPQDKPVADVPVNIFTVAGEGDPLLTGGWSHSQVRTDASGRFRFNAIHGGTASFWVEPANFAPLSHSVAKSRGDLGRLKLNPGATVSGRVVDDAGKAVPEVFVNVRPENRQLIWSTDGDRSSRVARTDADGKFKLAPLAAGSYRAYVADRDESESRDQLNEKVGPPLPAPFVPVKFDVPAQGAAPTLEMRGLPSVTVRAQYVDSAGRPTHGHDVMLSGRRTAKRAAAKPGDGALQGNGGATQGTAAFVLEDESAGSFSAIGRVNAKGTIEIKVPRGLMATHLSAITNEHSVLRIRRGTDGALSNSTEVDLGTLDKDLDDLYIVRYKAPLVVVRGVDTDGKTIAEIKPRIDYPAGTRPPRPAGSRWVTGVEGDVLLQPQTDGRWRSSQLLPDQEFTLTVSAPGHASASQKLKLGEGETKEIDVQLKPGGGQAKAAVGGTQGAIELGVNALGGTSQVGLTQGTFQLTAAPPAAAEAKPATAATSDERTIVDGTTGKPLAGVKVVVEHLIDAPMGRKLVETTHHVTDAQGKYQIPISAQQAADPSLALVIDASHPGYAALGRMLYGFQSQRRNQQLGNFQLFAQQRMYPGEEVTGVILDPQGKPLADLPLRVMTVLKKGDGGTAFLNSVADGESAGSTFLAANAAVHSTTETRTDANGRFRFSALTGGTAQFWVDPPGFAALTHSIEKQRGDIGSVQLEPGIRVAGRVIDVEGKPVPGVWVNLSPNTPSNPFDTNVDRATRAAQSDRDGAFELAPVSAGNYVAYVSTTASNDERARLESGNLPAAFDPLVFEVPAAGLEKPIEIRAVPHASISGEIVDSAGKPVADGLLAITGQRGRKSYTKIVTSDAKGRFDAKAPRDVRRAAISSVGSEDRIFRARRGKEGKLQNQPRIELGILDHDIDDIHFVRYQAPTLWLKIQDPSGQPIAELQPTIQYAATADWPENDDRNALVIPLAPGAWRTISLLPDEEFTLTVNAPGFKSVERKLKLSEGAEEKVELKLQHD